MLRRTCFIVVWALGQLVIGVACMGRMPGCGSPPEVVERDNVLGLVAAQDSIITYADRRTPLGALFEEEHRYALAWEEVPAAWVVAIVASEDGRFWHHSGVDAAHMARALDLPVLPLLRRRGIGRQATKRRAQRRA